MLRVNSCDSLANCAFGQGVVHDFDAARGCYKVFVLKEGRAIALLPVSVQFNAPLVVSLKTRYLSGQLVPHCESAPTRELWGRGGRRVSYLFGGYASNHMEA